MNSCLLQGLDAADATWSMASLTAFMRLCKSPVKRSSRGGAALLACVCLDESRCALRLVGPVSLPARKRLGLETNGGTRQVSTCLKW